MSGVLKQHCKIAWEDHVYIHLNGREPAYRIDCEHCYNMLAKSYSKYVAGMARYRTGMAHRVLAHLRLENIARGIGLACAAVFQAQRAV